jgi:hypothetical protein
MTSGLFAYYRMNEYIICVIAWLRGIINTALAFYGVIVCFFFACV